MSAIYEIAAIQTIVHALRDDIPPDQWVDTPLPLIAAPASWLQAVARELGQPEGMVPEYIHNCPVVQEDSLQEPVLITHDERVYRLRDLIPGMGAPPQPEGRQWLDTISETLRNVRRKAMH